MTNLSWILLDNYSSRPHGLSQSIAHSAFGRCYMANFINCVKTKVLSIKETDAFLLASFEKLLGTAPGDETLDRLNALEVNMTRLKQDLVRSSFEL